MIKEITLKCQKQGEPLPTDCLTFPTTLQLNIVYSPCEYTNQSIVG